MQYSGNRLRYARDARISGTMLIRQKQKGDERDAHQLNASGLCEDGEHGHRRSHPFGKIECDNDDDTPAAHDSAQGDRDPKNDDPEQDRGEPEEDDRAPLNASRIHSEGLQLHPGERRHPAGKGQGPWLAE